MGSTAIGKYARVRGREPSEQVDGAVYDDDESEQR
jgi:hypothetical protein